MITIFDFKDNITFPDFYKKISDDVLMQFCNNPIKFIKKNTSNYQDLCIYIYQHFFDIYDDDFEIDNYLKQFISCFFIDNSYNEFKNYIHENDFITLFILSYLETCGWILSKKFKYFINTKLLHNIFNYKTHLINMDFYNHDTFNIDFLYKYIKIYELTGYKSAFINNIEIKKDKEYIFNYPDIYGRLEINGDITFEIHVIKM